MRKNIPNWVFLLFIFLGLYPLFISWKNNFSSNIEYSYLFIFLPLSIGIYFEVSLLIKLSKIITFIVSIAFLFISFLPFFSINFNVNGIFLDKMDSFFEIFIPCFFISVIFYYVSKKLS